MIGQDAETFSALLVSGVGLAVFAAAYALGWGIRSLRCRDLHRLPVCGSTCLPPDHGGAVQHAYDRHCWAPRRRPVAASKLMEPTRDMVTGEVRSVVVRGHRGRPR